MVWCYGEPTPIQTQLEKRKRLGSNGLIFRSHFGSRCTWDDRRSAAVAGKDRIATLVRFAQLQFRELLAAVVDTLALALLSAHDLTNVVVFLDRLEKTAR